MLDTHFTLISHSGQTVSDTDFRGSFMLVYFGFTHCRVVCPRSLSKLSAVLELLGDEARRIVPLYVTVDPVRDTPATMKSYLEGLYPRFTGLTGTPEQIDSVKRSFRVFAERKASPSDPTGYDVPHTAIAYLIGPDGEYRAHFPEHLEEGTIKARIAAIIDQEISLP